MTTLMALLISIQALAQTFDSTLLNGSKASSSAPVVQEPERYIRKTFKPKSEKKRKPASKKEEEETSSAPVVAPAVAPLPTLQDPTKVNVAPQPVLLQENPEPSFGQQVRDIFLGGDLEMVDKYRTFLDPEDIRKNIFEFNGGISYIYNTSLSSYYFRNYINVSPATFAGLSIWVTPFLSLSCNTRFSVLNETKDSPTQDSFVSTTHTWFDLGLQFRRFFGMSVNASSVVFGLRYVDYAFSVPPTASSRLKQHTRGPAVDLNVSIPSSKHYFWNFGFTAQPFLVHEETIGGTDVRAGSTNETAAVGINLGGEYRFSRQTRTFFRFSSLLYKSQFSGSASAIDPVTGARPGSVPVNNIFYILDFGVTLGK